MLAFEALDEGRAKQIILLHGIFGRGRNLRGLAQGLAERCPDWGAILVDLREHGGSRGLAEPHTVQTCAADVRALLARYGQTALVAHSFGGKVALLARSGQPTWLLDSFPGARPEAISDNSRSVQRVLHLLGETPGPFAKRAAFVGALVRLDVDEGTAQWLATNLEQGDGGLRFGLNLENMKALLDSYYRTDVWNSLDAACHLVIAGRSESFGAGDREKALSLARQTGLGVHILEAASHWVHMDSRDFLVDAISQDLNRGDS